MVTKDLQKSVLFEWLTDTDTESDPSKAHLGQSARADLETVTNRVEKLRDNVRRPRPNREGELLELETLEPIVSALEGGAPLHEIPLTDPQCRAISSLRLLTEKPKRKASPSRNRKTMSFKTEMC